MPPAASTPGQPTIEELGGEVDVSSGGRERPVRWVGKYRILSELGRGGMANVYLAVAQGPGGVAKLVVLKALLPDLASEPGALAMFLDEARLAAQLNHANVVQTYEVGTEGERQVIVMEYLEGQSLAQIIKRTELAGHAVSPAMHLRVVINALEGLHYAHELCGYDGTPLMLVHRDVSPQNIFVTYGGQVKVLDFGIAKASSSSTHTATGIVKGKISYMAPEQMVADIVDRRADVYSVGCMLWAIATGKKLWKDTPDVHIMRRVINGEIPSPQSVSPGCDDELNNIVMKALAAEREQRYQTALELQEALESYCERFTIHVKQKEIGQHVSTLFADTRAELKALVERQLSLAATDEIVSTGDFSRSEVRNSASRSRSNPMVELGAQSASGLGQASAQQHRRWLPWAIVALLVVFGLGFFASRSSSPSAPAANTRVLAPPPIPAPVATVATLQFHATPADAKLFLDDQSLPSNPTSKVLPIDGAVHRLRAEAPGFATGAFEFSVSRDGALEINLVKAEVAATAPPARAARGALRVQKPAAPASKPSSASAPAVAAPAPKPCAQPFFVDADGIKKLRPECR